MWSVDAGLGMGTLSPYIRRMPYLGEITGLGTAVMWAFTSIFFARAGREIGSYRVNKIRLIMAVLIYTLVLPLYLGSLISPELTWTHVAWLAASGIIGLVFGDGCGFKALVMIGPRLTTLMYATAPIIATIFAWLFLGEALGIYELLGIVVTIGGVSWVVAERRFPTAVTSLPAGHPDSGSLLKGVMYGLGAATGQAVGLVLAKHAMLDLGSTIEPMHASYIRMIAATVVIWAMAAMHGQAVPALQSMKNRRAMGFSLGGAVAGPFLGVWMSLVSVSLIAAGVAATLNGTTPVMILPLVLLMDKEKLSVRAVFGTIVTVAGVAILFLA